MTNEAEREAERFFLIPCRRCDGEGAIYTDTTNWDGPSERADPCPVCNGKADEMIEEGSDD